MYEKATVGLLNTGGSVFQKGLMFLMRLAWKSSVRLPYLIMVGFMVLDVRITLEVQIDIDTHMTEEDSSSEDSELSDSELDSDVVHQQPVT